MIKSGLHGIGLWENTAGEVPRRGIYMQRRIAVVTVIFLCVLSLLTGGEKCVAYAEEGAAGNGLSGDVEVLRQDGLNYVMQVTVENSGEDFYGTVQVVFVSGYGYGNCAYDTEISLPSQGKKQFTANVAWRAVETIEGLCSLNFLDEKGRLLQSIPLKNVFDKVVSGVAVGVLSDDYSGLTYLDAGGRELYVNGNDYPLSLVQLDKDNLDGYLEGLYFLVIDQFNVSSLREDQIQAIQNWVEKGGGLIIGTGAYAEQTLSGFDKAFLDTELSGISEPGEENLASENVDKYGYYEGCIDEGVDFRQMRIARLNWLGNMYESEVFPAAYANIGDGAVAVYYSSLGDKELQKLSKFMVNYMYEELMEQSNGFQSTNKQYSMESTGQRLLAFVDSRNTVVDFSLLKWLIGIYVVLVGPVLYLILRKTKKNEWYWVGVPALGLLFIAVVFLLGQGARVNEARVYSVTVQQADSNRKETYFMAYHSGIKPWEIRLEDCYDVAGPGWNGYDGKYIYDASDYFYSVSHTSEGLSVGIKPQENFENGFIYAGGSAEPRGTLSGTQIEVYPRIGGGLCGTVANETDCDMAYMAVWLDQELMVLKDVKAGENLDLQQAISDGRCVYQNSSVEKVRDLLYSDLISLYDYRSAVGRDYRDDDMGVLIMGLGVAVEAVPKGREYAVIVGIVKDYDRAVAERCQETSYGCLYGYGETGV